MAVGLLAVGFLVGSIPFGLLVGKACGVDVRTAGSGNIGATNVWRTCGRRAGLAVFALDVAKGLAPTMLAQTLRPEHYGLHVLAGLAALFGHAFSPFLGFQGGKAVSTCLGVVLALSPTAGLSGLALWALLVRLTGYVSVGSLAGSLTAAVVILFTSGHWAYRLAMWTAAILIWVRHRANIQRLLRGEELRYDGTQRASASLEPPSS
jgi:glycerol-3-phosphate acyltransferase PlsY